MAETRSVPRNVTVFMVGDEAEEFEGKIVSYEGGFLILRDAENLACANAIPMHRIHEVVEEPVNRPAETA